MYQEDEEENDPDPQDEVEDPVEQPASLNDCLKSLDVVRSFFQSNGGDESVFNSIENLEGVSLALSLQANNKQQSRMTDFFKPK